MATKRELRTVLSLDGERAYTAGLERVSKNMTSLNSEQRLLNSQFDRGDKSLAKLSQQHSILERRLEEQRKKVDLVRKAYEESAKGGEKNAEVTQSLGNELNAAQADLNNMERALKNLERDMQTAGSRTEQFKAKMKELGITGEAVANKMSEISGKIANAMAAAAAAVVTASAKSYMDLQDEMANVGTIADTSAVSLEELTNQAIEASNATGVAATEIAQAQYQAISANVATADASALVEKAAKAAKAGVSDVTTVIDGSTSIINGWGIAMSDSTAVFDKLLLTQKLGKTTIGELASGIGQVTGLAPQLNISLDETLAAVAALTQNGVATASALTGMKAVMSSIMKPTAEATKTAESLGLQFDSAALKAKGFTGFLADVMEKTGGSDEQLAKLFGSVEGLSEVMLLGGQAADMYANVLDQLSNSAGTMEEMFSQRTSSASERFSMSLNNLKNAGIKLGEEMSPYIDMVADKIGNISARLAEMDATQALNIVKSALAIAAALKFVSVGLKVVANLDKIKTAASAVGTLMGSGGAFTAGMLGAAGAAALLVVALGKFINSSAEKKLSLDYNFDASDITNYKIDAQTLKNPIEVNAEAKLKIKTDTENVAAEIEKWLNDGVPETPEEQAAMTEKLNSAIQGAFDAVETAYNAEKENLETLLANGLISQEQYDADMADLEAQTTSLTSDLEAKSQAVTDYVATLVANNRATTQAEIDTLNELVAALSGAAQAAIDASDAQTQVYQLAYDKTRLGIGDESDRTKAYEWIELQTQSELDAIEAKRQALNALIAGQTAGKSDSEIVAITNSYQSEIDTLDAAVKSAEEKKIELYKALNPMSDVDIEKSAEWLAAYEQVFKAYQNYNNFGAVMNPIWWESLFGDDNEFDWLNNANAAIDALLAKYPELDAYLKTLSANGIVDGDLSTTEGIANVLAQVTENAAEASESVDALKESLGESTESSPVIDDVDRDVGIIQDGEAALEDAADGLKSSQDKAMVEMHAFTEGINSYRGTVGSSMGEVASFVSSSFSQALAIHSPSKVFAGHGQNVMLGLINGIKSKKAALSTTLNDITAMVKATNVQIQALQTANRQAGALAASTAEYARQAVNNTTVINNVNYTAGAGTRKEAETLSKHLANSQRKTAQAYGG